MTFSDTQLDAFREIINMGMGQAAGVLNTMTDSHVELQLPSVQILTVQELQARIHIMPEQIHSTVQMGFVSPFKGNASLVFPPESAAKLAMVLVGEDPSVPALDEIRTATLSEVGNIVLNSVMGAISNELKLHISYLLPVYYETALEPILLASTTEYTSQVIWIVARFVVQAYQIMGDIIIILEVGALDRLMSAIEQQIALNR